MYVGKILDERERARPKIVDAVRNIFLVGFMASGKTTVGVALTRMLGWPLIDGDDEIVRQTGKSIETIFKESGEGAFRQLERSVINDLCSQQGRIIAPGGGAFVDHTNRVRMLESGEVFCLNASPDTIHQRLSEQSSDGAVRPLMDVEDPVARIQELLSERHEAYSQAHHMIDTDRLSPNEIADLIRQACRLDSLNTGA